MPARHRYVLADQVGAGGMGTVWRAWDRDERRWVAAKLLSRYDAGALERFVREQGLRVRHRHVLQPTDCALAPDGGRMLFTMDLVRGGSLEQLLHRHGPLPEAWVRVVLEQTLEALVAVHAAGVVHRDVKPGNLLLEPTGTGRPWVRLGDFGIAVVAGDPRLTQVPGGVGTGGYSAPEQAAGAAPDPRQDLYAAGVVAGELLSGRPPHRSVDAPVSGPLRGLLARLTDADPDSRPATAAEALHLLRQVGVPEGTPWQAGPRPPDVLDLFGDPRPPRSRWRPGVPAYVWAVPGVFVAAGGAGGLASWLVLR